jgi:hypothetical protein
MKQRLLLLVMVLALTAATARADVAPAPPLWSRISTTEIILVGRVSAIEDRDIEAPFPYGGGNVKYRIAVVTVIDGIKDAKNIKTVRLGFIPPPPDAPKLSRPRFSLVVGDEGLFYLTKHPKQNFYLVPGYYDYVPSKSAICKDQAAEAKRLSKLLENVQAGLVSKDRDERFLSAALLVSNYRHRGFVPGKVATEPIDAAQSKLILTAILEADWTKSEPPFGQAPLVVFNMLGLTKADGWAPPLAIGDPAEHAKAAQAWLKQNAATYRIQRMVREK